MFGDADLIPKVPSSLDWCNHITLNPLGMSCDCKGKEGGGRGHAGNRRDMQAMRIHTDNEETRRQQARHAGNEDTRRQRGDTQATGETRRQ